MRGFGLPPAWRMAGVLILLVIVVAFIYWSLRTTGVLPDPVPSPSWSDTQLPTLSGVR